TVAIDKTGTITEGKPRLIKVMAVPGLEDNEILRLVASLERHSEHPLAAAVLRGALERELALVDPESFDSITGGGVAGRVQGREVIVGNQPLLASKGINVPGTVKAETERLQVEGNTVVLTALDGKCAGLL